MLARLCKLTRLFVALIERRTRVALGGNHDDEEANGLADALALVAAIGVCSFSLGRRLM
jgi:DNA repair exonuclease SbcCD nuclease subunit